MRTRFSKILIGAVAVASMCVQTGHAALGSGPVIIAGADAKTLGYATRAMVIQKGQGLTFINADIETHNVVTKRTLTAEGACTAGCGSDSQPWCEAYPVGACPLFFSPVAGIGVYDVHGIDKVEPGAIYTFECEIHPGQEGTLVVLPA